MKRFLYFFIFLSLCLAFVWVYNQANDGFGIRQIQSNWNDNTSNITSEIDNEKKDLLETIFAQNFHYIGKGCQFYVFESSDHQYVIKFFKQKHLRSWEWALAMPLPSFLNTYFEKKNSAKKEKMNQLFSSCHLAYEKMPEETGLVYLHLYKTDHLRKNIQVKSKLGLFYQISLDDFSFIVQKKGTAAKEFLLGLSSRNNPQEIATCLTQITASIIHRCQKGIIDQDRSFVQNIGFFPENGQVQFIDFGQFKNNLSMLDKEKAYYETLRRLNALKAWCNEKCPMLTQFVENEISNYSENQFK